MIEVLNHVKTLEQVLLMTLQNAPPGLDYDRDKKFSKVSSSSRSKWVINLLQAVCNVGEPSAHKNSQILLLNMNL